MAGHHTPEDLATGRLGALIAEDLLILQADQATEGQLTDHRAVEGVRILVAADQATAHPPPDLLQVDPALPHKPYFRGGQAPIRADG